MGVGWTLSELDYDAAAGADRAAPGGAARRVAAARLRARRRGVVRHRRFADLPDELRPASSSSSTTRGSCRRGSRSSRRAARCCCSSASTATSGRPRPADAPAAGGRTLRRRSSSSSTSARAAGALRLDGEPAGETPLPPYITEPLADPERYQTVYARERRLRGRADRGAALHARAARARSTSSASRSTSASTRSGRVAAEQARGARIHGERYEVAPPAWERIRAAERVLAVGTTTVRVLETLAARRAARGTDRALRHAGVRVPARRRAADELPSPALDAARARDGVRRRRADAPAVPARGRGALPLLLLRRRDADPVRLRLQCRRVLPQRCTDRPH